MSEISDTIQGVAARGTAALDAGASRAALAAPPPSPSVLPKLDATHKTVGHPLCEAGDPPAMVSVRDFCLHYGPKQALFNVSADFLKNHVTALIGPSGCGKSTLLRSINRLQDLIPHIHMSGDMSLHGEPIYGSGVDVISLRKKIGMVFQKPNVFPMSIYDNVVYGLRIAGVFNRHTLNEAAQSALEGAALWNEVKDRLNKPASGLSGGQQQRLCIARAIAVKPEVLLMDEPTSALDPISTSRVEDLMVELKQRVTIITVTHNMQQAGRVADETAFMYMGRLIELDATRSMFTNPSSPMTEQYLTGRFG